MTGKTQNIEYSAELPVEQLYNQSVQAFKQSYAELQAGGEDLPAVEGALRSMGVEVDNDASMFIMGAVGKVGLDAASTGLGVAANSPLNIAADVSASAYSMRDEERSSRSFKSSFSKASNDAGKKTDFAKKATFKRAPQAAVAAPRKMATNLLMAASASGQAKKKQPAKLTEAKRNELKKNLQEQREIIEQLAVFKSCGCKYARKQTMIDADGERKTLLVASGNDNKVALTPANKGRQSVNTDQRFDRRQNMGMHASL